MNTFGNTKCAFNIFIVSVLTSMLILAACGADKDGEQKTYTVGILNHAANLDQVIEGFKTKMADLSYTEGENITYIYEGATGSIEALGPAAKSLASQDLDLVLAIATPAATVAQSTFNTDLPIIFVPVNDPVEAGLVETIAQPGGNLTGIRNTSTIDKAFQWLIDIVPETQRAFVLHSPGDIASVTSLEQLNVVAEAISVDLVVQEVSSPSDIVEALEAIPADVDAVFLVRSGMILSQVEAVVQAANARNLPTAAPQVGSLNEAGVLVSYGSEYRAMGGQAARLAKEVLKGINPGALPVETAAAYLWVNLETAQTIGVEVPDTVLRQADQIIRPAQ